MKNSLEDVNSKLKESTGKKINSSKEDQQIIQSESRKKEKRENEHGDNIKYTNIHNGNPEREEREKGRKKI